MNILHRRYCRSDSWRQAVHHGMLPWVLGEIDLGANVLEIGPGPGVTTDWLRERVPALTCIEIDRKLADALKARLNGTNVTVVEGDATAMPFPDQAFDFAVCFTMLHHVPSRDLQDRLLAETLRVLKPGALFTGSDSTPSLRFRLFHVFDTCVPADPETFAARLEAAGFIDAQVVRQPQYNTFKFSARKG
ncbi:MAG TPA: class I SAM-dependent methyltransferase [Dehalococcoidia bacterium]|jgi:ubiquinone/menaquinone biosynthesis C-methylase UbiE|nr:class I SAM-dependent methyltransferase [Dehalococcoidia bacterium]